MTNFTTKLMIAATTLMAAATCASAQNLKAEIPFSFRVEGKAMPAGTYRLADISSAGNKIFRIAGGGAAVLAVTRGTSDADRAWQAKGQPVLSFQCAENRCSLAKVWTGSGDAYSIAHPKTRAGEPVRMATVVLHPDKAD